MSYSVIQQGDSVEYGVKQFCVNTAADIPTIPITSSAPGSTVFVIADSSVYMLNTSSQWVEI